MGRSWARNVGTLWDAADIDDGDRSGEVYVGSAPHVAIFVKNASAVNMTFGVEAAGIGTRGDTLNAAVADWYPYLRMNATDENFAPVEFAVAAGETRCFDLHDFTPGRLSLVVSHANGSAVGDVTAFTEHFPD